MRKNKKSLALVVVTGVSPSTMEGCSVPMEALARYSRQVPVTFARVVTDREENILTMGDESTESFFAFTGFTRRDVQRAGGKMRFLQGRETSDAALGVIRAGLEAERPVSTVLLNYTKSGSPFWNIISIRPCLDRAARPAYVASMCLVPVRGLSNGFELTRRGGLAIAPQQCVELLRALSGRFQRNAQRRCARCGVRYGPARSCRCRIVVPILLCVATRRGACDEALAARVALCAHDVCHRGQRERGIQLRG